MARYQFQFTVCPGEKGFWVDIRNQTIEVSAESIGEATEKFVQALEEEHFVTISKTARKRPQTMYTEFKDGHSEESGRVYTGSMEIDYGDGHSHADYRRKWVQVWTSVYQMENVYRKVA